MRFLSIVRSITTKSHGFVITTPIYYANAGNPSWPLNRPNFGANHSSVRISAPHLGHLYSSVIADTINRYQKISAVHNVNIFSTGTDEHGIKVLQAASKRGVPVAQYCDEISSEYKKLFDASGVDYTDFIRTTEGRHKDAVWKFWELLKSQNAIYKDSYAGWYCVQDETFLANTQLKLHQGERFSAESGHPVEWTEEENYMFKLSEYQDEVLYWAKHE